MQNAPVKVLEKIIARKLSSNLEGRCVFPLTLGGHRSNKETWLNATAFAKDAFEGFQVRVETCVAEIDPEDGYNRVPFNYLIRMLLRLKVHPIPIRWTDAALIQ